MSLSVLKRATQGGERFPAEDASAHAEIGESGQGGLSGAETYGD